MNDTLITKIASVPGIGYLGLKIGQAMGFVLDGYSRIFGNFNRQVDENGYLTDIHGDTEHNPKFMKKDGVDYTSTDLSVD